MILHVILCLLANKFCRDALLNYKLDLLADIHSVKLCLILLNINIQTAILSSV